MSVCVCVFGSPIFEKRTKERCKMSSTITNRIERGSVDGFKSVQFDGLAGTASLIVFFSLFICVIRCVDVKLN